MTRSAKYSAGLVGALVLFAAVGSDAQTARSTPVTVVNLPAVQAVEELNRPAYDPMQMSAEQSTEISFPNTVLVTGAYLPAVPDGKRLVVQHVSVYMSSEELDADPSCRVRVRPEAEPTSTVFAHRFPTEREFTGVREVAVYASPMTMYVDAGMEVGASCTVRVSADTFLEISVSGYYVTLP